MATRISAAQLPPDDDGDGMTAAHAIPISSSVTIPPASEPEETEETVIDRLRALMQQSPAERIKVKCYRARNGSLEWCDDFTPEEFEDGDLKMIRDRHGPGKYEFRLMTSKGIARRIQVHIAPAAELTPASNPRESAQNSELAQVLAMLAQGQRQLLEAVTHRPDPMENMQQMLALAAAMREAFGVSNAAPTTPPQNQMAMLKEVLELSREVKATARELAGDDDKPAADPSDPMSMLPGVLDLVKTAMSQNQPAQPPQTMQPIQPLMLPASIAHSHAPIPTPEQPAQSEGDTVETLVIRGLLEDLCQLAADGKPPTDGAEFIFEKLPDELIDAMGQRYWFEIVALRFPLVKAHEKWLREAKAEADKLFASAEAGEGENDDTPSNTPTIAGAGR